MITIIYVYVYIYIYIYAHILIHYIYIYIYTYVCVYIYKYIYIYSNYSTSEVALFTKAGERREVLPNKTININKFLNIKLKTNIVN